MTRQSGKRRIVVMRRACSERLRTAMHYWAGVYAQHDPKGQALYRAVKARGRPTDTPVASSPTASSRCSSPCSALARCTTRHGGRRSSPSLNSPLTRGGK
ncbi:MAG: hypothetical protein IPK07_07895, partial [Deltaproteobacteria bacterium]|nr:hypothetical protein [Deltaproteobacteria bacterium]